MRLSEYDAEAVEPFEPLIAQMAGKGKRQVRRTQLSIDTIIARDHNRGYS
jgi:hypothetical protein